MMEKQLSWVLKVTLKEMAFRSIMVSFWNKTIILALNKNLSLKSHSYSVRTQNASDEYYVSNINKVIEDMVKDDVLELMLPECLEKRMMHLIKPIGSEIFKWQVYHERIIDSLCKKSYICILKQLYWTSTGVIDYRKTAEALVRLEILDVSKRYRLACLYCIADYIPLLWEKFPEETKGHFYNDSHIHSCAEATFESYWAHVLTEEVHELDAFLSGGFRGILSFRQFLFEDSARRGNKAATEYFYGKLTNGERDFSLFRTISYIITILNPN